MDQREVPPRDTRELLARWNAVTEGHLTEKLKQILRQLGGEVPGEGDAASEPYEALASHVLHALQVAAAPGGTVHDAIAYLEAAVDAGPDQST